jgi:hypothetical protein
MREREEYLMMMIMTATTTDGMPCSDKQPALLYNLQRFLQFIALMMEAAVASETSVNFYQTS